MEIISNNQAGVQIELGLFDTLKGLFLIEPIFLFGIIVIGILLAVIFQKDGTIPKMRTVILSLAIYYYLCFTLENIVGIPTFAEYIRIARLGESFFHPNINLVPLGDGFQLSFILNIFLFIPLGFLCPLLSKTFERARNIFLIGLGFSLFIEIAQLFTLYRATDINDLLTNVIGTMLGYLCFRVIAKLRIVKLHSRNGIKEQDHTAYIPIVILMIAAVLCFFS